MMAGDRTKKCTANWNLITQIELWNTDFVLSSFCINSHRVVQTYLCCFTNLASFRRYVTYAVDKTSLNSTRKKRSHHMRRCTTKAVQTSGVKGNVKFGAYYVYHSTARHVNLRAHHVHLKSDIRTSEWSTLLLLILLLTN